MVTKKSYLGKTLINRYIILYYLLYLVLAEENDLFS